MRDVKVEDIGLRDYLEVWEYQKKRFQAAIDTKLANRNLPETEQQTPQNYLVFCEHPHVVTLGKSGDMGNLLLSEALLKKKGIQFYNIDRGGDITYHGPEQQVGYPIIDLDQFKADINVYMRNLEAVIISTLAEYGIKGGRIKDATGVWLDEDKPQLARKICAMGVRTSRWVTMHGFALNVNNDLDYFNVIIPCGLQGKQVTSIEKELGYKVDKTALKEKIKRHFSRVFNATLIT